MGMALPGLEALSKMPDKFLARFVLRLEELQLTGSALSRFDFHGPDVGDALRRPLQQWAARQEGTLAALAVAFLRLGEALSESEVARIFGSSLANGLREAGLLLDFGAGRISFALKLGSLGERWILSDGDLTHPDAVMGPSAATARIFDTTLQDSSVDSLLDLGCGGGALALALGGMARRVAGTDISPRALQFAAINSRLNGIPNAAFRLGDLYEPFAGERFDRIVCQPPFIPSLDGASIFASGGPLGDAITLRVLRGIADALKQRGRALLCVEWARSEEHEWLARFREATAGMPLHTVHFDCYRTAADDYCVLLAPYIYSIADPGYAAFVKAMLGHYKHHGISTIDLVIHAIEPSRDGVAREWVRRLSLESLPFLVAKEIDTSLAALPLIDGSDEELATARLRIADGLSPTGDDLAGTAVLWATVNPQSLARPGYLERESLRVAMSFGDGAFVKDLLPPDRKTEWLERVRQLIRDGYLVVCEF